MTNKKGVTVEKILQIIHKFEKLFNLLKLYLTNIQHGYKGLVCISIKINKIP